ncbi:MAG: glycosyltransferase family 39 protein [Armatimonadota bacterium]
MIKVKRHLIVVLVVAFAVRLSFVMFYPGSNWYGGISNMYLDVASNALHGKGFSVLVDASPLGRNTPEWVYTPFIQRPLAYPVFIALILFLFGRTSFMVVQIVQAFLGALNVLLVYSIAKRFLSLNLALASSWVVALWPVTARFEVALLPESVVSFFVLGGALFLLRGVEDRHIADFIISGVFYGFSILFRPDNIILPIILAGALLFQLGFKGGLKRGIIFLVVTGALLIPQTIRNYNVTGGYILPLGIGSGISLWEGISQFGERYGTVYSDVKTAEVEGYRYWDYPNGVERDRKRFNQAIKIIKEHPFWYAGVMLRRIPVLFTITTGMFSLGPGYAINSFTDLVQYFRQYPLACSLNMLIVFLQYLVVLFGAIGMWISRSYWKATLPLVMIFWYYVFVHIPTNAEVRYFLPTTPLLIPFAVRVAHRILRQKGS